MVHNSMSQNPPAFTAKSSNQHVVIPPNEGKQLNPISRRHPSLNPEAIAGIVAEKGKPRPLLSPFAGDIPKATNAAVMLAYKKKKRSKWSKCIPSVDWENVRSLLFKLFVASVLFGVGQLFHEFKPETRVANTAAYADDILRSLGLLIAVSIVAKRVLHTIFVLLSALAFGRTLKTGVYTLRSAEAPLAGLIAVQLVWNWYFPLIADRTDPSNLFTKLMILGTVMTALYSLRSMMLRYILGKTVERAYAQKVADLLKQQDTLHKLTFAGNGPNAGFEKIRRKIETLLNRNNFLAQVQYLEDHPLTLFEENRLVPIYSSERVRQVANSTFDDLLGLSPDILRTNEMAVAAEAAEWDNVHYGYVDLDDSISETRPGLEFTSARSLRNHPFFASAFEGKASSGSLAVDVGEPNTARTNTTSEPLSPIPSVQSSPRHSVQSTVNSTFIKVRPGEIAGVEKTKKSSTPKGSVNYDKSAMNAPVTEPEVTHAHFRSRLEPEAALSVLVLFDRNSSGAVSRGEFLDGFVSIYRNFKLLRKSLAGNSSISRAFAVVANMLYVVIMLFVCLTIFEISWSEFWLPTSAVFVAFSIHIGRLTQTTVQSLLLVLVMKPFEPGDEVAVSFVEGGKSSMTVETIDLLTTTFRKSNGRFIQVPNYVLFDGSIENYSRSSTVNFTVTLDVSITTTIPQIVELRERLLLYMRSRPLEWKPQLYVSVDDTVAPEGIMKVSFSVTHHLGWKEGGRIYASRTDFIMTALEVMADLNIGFTRPHMPITIDKDVFPAPRPAMSRANTPTNVLRYLHAPNTPQQGGAQAQASIGTQSFKGGHNR